MSLNVVLKPDNPKHKKLLNALEERLKLSHEQMSKRYSVWRDAEQVMRMYLPETELDAGRRRKREGGKPDYTTIIVPHTYATLMTFHTYASSVFLARSPIFQYTARHGEGTGQVAAVEALVDYQVQVGQMLVPLYIWVYDTLKYGIGIIGEYWDEQEIVVSEIAEEPVEFMGIQVPGKTQKVKRGRVIKGYCGNKLFNVRPQDWFPDPRKPLAQFQDGEFCGRYIEEPWNSVMTKQANGTYFNIDYVRAKQKGNNADGAFSSGATEERDAGHPSAELPDATRNVDAGGIPDVGYLRGYEMSVKLVPSQWDLGSSERVEVWNFTFVRNQAIIKCRPAGTFHGRFPFEVNPFEIDGYALFARGLVEMVKPLEDGMTWLLNSHLYNVRKELNGTIVFDPMRVEAEDVMDTDPGKRVRLKPGFMGTDVRSAMFQFQGQDVTRGHIADMQVLEQISFRAQGINENIMGAVNSGGRKTATEVRSSSTFGINRLKNHCEFWSAHGWGPLAQKLLQNSQQYYDADKKMRIVKDLASRNAAEFVQVNPESIAGFYDFVAVDGTMPVDKLALAALWKDLLMQFRNLPPQVAGQFDIAAIVTYAMQLAGAPDVNQFKVKVQPPGAPPPAGAVPLQAPPGGPSSPEGVPQGAPIVGGARMG